MSDEKDDVTAHYTNSVLREVILEHLFVGEVLRRLWVRGVTDAEILHSEFDAGGYDVVLSHRQVTRHIQLKSKLATGKAAEVKVSLNLAAKPSGCVVWIIANPELTFRVIPLVRRPARRTIARHLALSRRPAYQGGFGGA